MWFSLLLMMVAYAIGSVKELIDFYFKYNILFLDILLGVYPVQMKLTVNA